MSTDLEGRGPMHFRTLAYSCQKVHQDLSENEFSQNYSFDKLLLYYDDIKFRFALIFSSKDRFITAIRESTKNCMRKKNDQPVL